MKFKTNPSVYTGLFSVLSWGVVLCTFYTSTVFTVERFYLSVLKNYFPSMLRYINKELGGLTRIAFHINQGVLVISLLLIVILIFKNKHTIRVGWIWYLLPLVGLLVLARVSVLWSVKPSFTKLRYWYFLAITLVGLLVGISFSERKIISLFSMFFVIVTLSSFVSALYLNYGIRNVFSKDIFGGGLTWRGIFRYKNTLGSIMALANGFYLYLLTTHFSETASGKRIYYITLYVGTLALTFLSRSAGGFVSVVGITAIYLMILALLKWGHLLRPAHWRFLIIIILITLAIAWFARGDLLQMIGKDITLTNRTRTWSVLFDFFVKQRPYFGYGGFGAFWKTTLKKTAPWAFIIPNNSESGYVEMFLSLGIVGASVFFITFFENLILGIKNILTIRSPKSVWPLMLFLHFAITNIVSDNVGRIEFFFWFVFVITLVYNIRVFKQKPTVEA